MFIDTHCHIHEKTYPLDQNGTISRAHKAGVDRLVCVGTSAQDSEVAADFVQSNDSLWFTLGHHPHEAEEFDEDAQKLMRKLVVRDKLVAIGECGLDYWYLNASKESQEACLRFQIELGLEHKLPFVFHIRGSKEDPVDAFTDAWRIIDEYEGVKGIVHSFTASPKVLEQVLMRELYVGINGILTFTKDEQQLAMLDTVPLDKMVLETDAPFLTPQPFRGTVNEPKHLVEVARFIAKRKGVTLQTLADVTSVAARTVFKM